MFFFHLGSGNVDVSKCAPKQQLFYSHCNNRITEAAIITAIATTVTATVLQPLQQPQYAIANAVGGESMAMILPDWALSRYVGFQFEYDIPKGRARLFADPWAYAAHEIPSTFCADWWNTILPDQLLALHTAGH